MDKIVRDLIHGQDIKCRFELYHQIIKDENEYTGNLCSGIRNVCHQLSLKAINCPIHAERYGKNVESLFGCDWMIIIRENNFARIISIEMKWPRLRIGGYGWDKMQGSISHFSSQLQRQSKYAKQMDIYEGIICDDLSLKQVGDLEDYGATFIKHENIFKYKKSVVKNSVWGQSHLLQATAFARKKKKIGNLAWVLENTIYAKTPLHPVNGGKINFKVDYNTFVQLSDGTYRDSYLSRSLNTVNSEYSIDIPVRLNDEGFLFAQALGIKNFTVIDVSN